MAKDKVSLVSSRSPFPIVYWWFVTYAPQLKCRKILYSRKMFPETQSSFYILYFLIDILPARKFSQSAISFSLFFLLQFLTFLSSFTIILLLPLRPSPAPNSSQFFYLNYPSFPSKSLFFTTAVTSLCVMSLYLLIHSVLFRSC